MVAGRVEGGGGWRCCCGGGGGGNVVVVVVVVIRGRLMTTRGWICGGFSNCGCGGRGRVIVGEEEGLVEFREDGFGGEGRDGRGGGGVGGGFVVVVVGVVGGAPDLGGVAGVEDPGLGRVALRAEGDAVDGGHDGGGGGCGAGPSSRGRRGGSAVVWVELGSVRGGDAGAVEV